MTSLDTFDAYCIANAAYFTAIRGRNPLTRSRVEFDSLDAAKEYAASFNDKATLIYAVTAHGRSAPIS